MDPASPACGFGVSKHDALSSISHPIRRSAHATLHSPHRCPPPLSHMPLSAYASHSLFRRTHSRIRALLIRHLHPFVTQDRQGCDVCSPSWRTDQGHHVHHQFSLCVSGVQQRHTLHFFTWLLMSDRSASRGPIVSCHDHIVRRRLLMWFEGLSP